MTSKISNTMQDSTEVALDILAAAHTNIVDVAQTYGHGTAQVPVTMQLASNTVYLFDGNTYYLSKCDTSAYGLSNVTFFASGATLKLVGAEPLIDAAIPHFSMIGGTIDGQNTARMGIFLNNSPHCLWRGVTFQHIGSAETEGAGALVLLGDCTGFTIHSCVIDDVTSGIVGTDGFIHAWGIFINRLNSNNTFPKIGTISGCTIKNIKGIDSSTKKADGDGIFIQAPPYLDGDGINWRKDSRIIIENCACIDCKKRAIKCAAPCVTVRDCVLSGAMWYAGIDARFGHMDIEGTYISNTTPDNDSYGCCIVANDGGMTIKNCTLDGIGNGTVYRTGIRIDKRFQQNPCTDMWENITIESCSFPHTTYAVQVYGTGEEELGGISMHHCAVGKFQTATPFVVSNTLVKRLQAFVFTDWEFSDGTSRDAVRAVNPDFRYPLQLSILPEMMCEIHAWKWTSEPMVHQYPTAPNGYIEITGNLGGMVYKRYTAHGSVLVGSRDPETVTSTLGKNMLYNSKRGDQYINTSNGSMWICTDNGSATSVGTWKKLSTV